MTALPPPPLVPTADAPERRLLADRQLSVPLRALPLTQDRPQSAERIPPYMPEGSELAIRPKYPATRAPFQAHLPLPTLPKGKGRSLGIHSLTPDEQHEAKVIRRQRLPVLPATRADCLAFRAVLPGKDEHPQRGDRGRRMAPCPFVSCRHHLYLDVNPETGAIKVNFPGLNRLELAEPWPRHKRQVTVEGGRREYLMFAGPPAMRSVLDLSPMEDTCSIDVGDRGERRGPELRNRKLDLRIVGRKMNLTMERARQVLEHAQGEAEAKATDGQSLRPLAGEVDPNDVAGDETP